MEEETERKEKVSGLGFSGSALWTFEAGNSLLWGVVLCTVEGLAVSETH